MAVDANGVSYINTEGTLPTYGIAIADYAPYATATDMVVIQNPSTSTALLKVSRISVSGTATAAGQMDIYALVRTAINTGGTSANISALAYDSNNPAKQATALSYSVAPTLNGTGTLFRADRVLLATTNAGTFINWEFGTRGGAQAIHLRPGQQLSINNNGNGVAAGTSLYINVEWTESTGSNPVQ